MQWWAAMVAIIAAALAVPVLSSCDLHSSTIRATALEQDITDRLARVGKKPESVRCAADLTDEIGQSTRCEVVLSPTNAIEPIARVTKVDGSKVTYELTPALSQPQLQQQVADLFAARNSAGVKSVSCDSGIEGVTGNKARCVVDSDGGTVDTVVTVTRVDGLEMDFSLDRG
jgi:hypothetical protein